MKDKEAEKIIIDLEEEKKKLIEENWELTNKLALYQYQIKCLLETIKILQKE